MKNSLLWMVLLAVGLNAEEIFVNGQLKCYPQAEKSLAYLYFRFYSDCERDAFFALGASSGGEFFFENRKICAVEPVSDAEYIAPGIVPVRLKKGYNILIAKCVLGQVPMQYRRVWGAMAKAFWKDI